MEAQNLKATELAKLLISGELPLRSYLEEVLELIETTEPIIHALLPEPQRKQRLFRDAQALADKYPDPLSRPPLFGLLVGVKDLFNVDGLPTQAGSKLPAEAFAGEEAVIVTRLKQLGAIILGKTVSTEFAYFSPGETCNPCNPKHSPGGSSSGSAAAVAVGYCLLALGTQTIASIIRPASYCGVYGYKPSWGRISCQGVFPFSQSADHVGLICRSIDDLSFLTGFLVPDLSTTRTQREPKMGIVRGDYTMQANGQVRANYADCIEALKDKGYRLVECDPFGDIELINAMHRKMIAAEFAINHRTLFAKFADLYSLQSRELYNAGLQIGSAELLYLKAERLVLRQKISKLMAENQIDLWLTPSTTCTAPLGLESTGSPLMSLPWTNAGLPSLSVPSGLSENSLPYGLQFIANWQQDHLLFSHQIQDVVTDICGH